MSTTTWPADLDHCEAVQTLLVMASAAERWGEPRRAAKLLERAEQIVGPLPPDYERIQRRCRIALSSRPRGR